MMSLEETGGACLTLISFSGFSCFAGSRFFDGFWSDFFALTGLGIWEGGEILVTEVTPITDHQVTAHGLGHRYPWNRPSVFHPRCVRPLFLRILSVTHPSPSALAKAGDKIIHVDPND